MSVGRRPGNGHTGGVATLIALVAAFTFFSERSAHAEPLRPLQLQPGDQRPAGDWTLVDPRLYQLYAAALTSGQTTAPPGDLTTMAYDLELTGGDSLIGSGTGTLRSISPNAILPVGRPSFAMSEVQIDRQPAVWGADPRGTTCIATARERSELQFRMSQQGLRRTDSVEFQIDWLTSVASSVSLTLPADRQLRGSGFLVTGEVPAGDGRTEWTLQIGARTNSILEITRRETSAEVQFGYALKQTISASTARMIIQAQFDVVPQSSGPVNLEFEVPAGYSMTRASLPGNERIPIQPGRIEKKRHRISLGDVSAGKRVECRVVMEKPATWSQPVHLPRVAPSNGMLLREEWTLQLEKPLELRTVDAPQFLQTGLTVEPARETWTWQGASRDATMVITAQHPEPVVIAECLTRRRSVGNRSELQSVIDLKSIRSALYDFEVDILKPWRIVSVLSNEANGGTTSLAYEALPETDDSSRYRVYLRSAATRQKGALVSIVVAGQAGADASAALRPVVMPRAETVDYSIIYTSEDRPTGLRSESNVSAAELRSSLRSALSIPTEEMSSYLVQRVDDPRNGASAKAARAETARIAGEQTNPLGTAATPFAKSSCVMELETTLGATSADSSEHRAVFVFDRPVELANATVAFNGAWQLIELRCDGLPLEIAAVSGSLQFPDEPRVVRELVLRYSTPGAVERAPRVDRVFWPQTEAEVERWTWRIRTPADRRISSVRAPEEFAAGIQRASLRERLFAPWGRGAGDPIFNPFSRRAWDAILGTTSAASTVKSRENEDFVASGREYPKMTDVVSWSAPRLEWLNWAIFSGSMLAVACVRRFSRGTFRAGGLLLAVAATAAWLSPPPFGSMAGALMCGCGIAFLLPRRLFLSAPRPASIERGSTARALAPSALVVLIWATCSAALGQPSNDGLAASNVVIIPGFDAEPETVYVSTAVAREIADWRLAQAGPAWLLQDARFDVGVDSSDAASIDLTFRIVVPRPTSTTAIQLPFDGFTFRGPDSASVDGQPTRILPASDGKGVVVPLPASSTAEEDGDYSQHEISLQGVLRITGGAQRREFSISAPRTPSAVAFVRSTEIELADVRTNARGNFERRGKDLTFALGVIDQWRLRWKTATAADRPTSDATVTGRAESMVFAEPDSLRLQSRVIIETPETADIFAASRLELLLPANSLVTSATGDTVLRWKTIAEPDATRVAIDLTVPPLVGHQIDLQYELPVTLDPAIELPPIPLLSAGRLSSHQIAVATTPAFEVQFLTEPDPDAGLWTLETSEASFLLRRDFGLPIPETAIELERPTSLVLELNPKKALRTAELEQAFEATGQAIRWTGTARIESAVRPGFQYEFRIDPAIEITSASVVERDVERLSRFIREEDRLLLILGDDRLGTKNVRLEGRLSLEAGKIRPAPDFELLDATITRREIVITSTLDRLLQARRRNDAPVLVPGANADWEPLLPATRRISQSSAVPQYEIRWINPTSPLKLVEFVRTPEQENGPSDIIWRLESTQPLPAVVAVDAPPGLLISDNSDFIELGRRTTGRDFVRIELQSRKAGVFEAVLRMTLPEVVGRRQLPHLADMTVRPESYLAVPRDRLADFEISGDFLNSLPMGAPASWSRPFQERSLLVFGATGMEWAATDRKAAAPLGTATMETVVSEVDGEYRGMSRWIVTPSRVGIMQVAVPKGCRILGIHASEGRLHTTGNSQSTELLLRPSQPLALIIDWSTPVQPETPLDVSSAGPSLNDLETTTTFIGLASETDTGPWHLQVVAPNRAIDLLARVRIENLLMAARLLPIGVRPPDWLRDELIALSRQYQHSPVAGAAAVQAAGMLDSWSARMSTLTAPNSVAPDPVRVTRDPQRILADNMLASARDPEVRLQTPGPGQSDSLRTRVLNAGFTTAWLVLWLFVITKGGQWAAQRRIADRLEQHPAIAVCLLGLVWWLFLSPSVLGAAVSVFALGWELAQRRRKAATLSGEKSAIA